MKKQRGRPKDRREHENLFGVNPIAEALAADRRKFHRITIKKGIKPGGATQKIIETAERKRIPVEHADIDLIAKLAGAEGHQGIVANVSTMPFTPLEKLLSVAPILSSPTIAVLDGVQDPRNFGSILRSAEVFGLDGVIFPSRRSATYTPVASKSSAGAGEHMRLCQVTNIAETVKQLRSEGFTCVAFDSAGETEFNAAPAGPLALVLGGEGTGARPLVVKRCDYAARIPMKGKVASLNVSAAAAIVFHLASIR